MKSKLKAPGTKRLKLTYENPLSSFAFNFKFRRFTKAARKAKELRVLEVAARRADDVVGR